MAKKNGYDSFDIIDFDCGLSIKIIDCNLKDAARFDLDLSTDHFKLPFSLSYFITPDAFLIEDGSQKRIPLNNIWNTVFTVGAVNLKYDIIPNKAAKHISILFTKEWIEAETINMQERQKKFVYELLNSERPAYFCESYNEEERKIASAIFDKFTVNKQSSLFYKSRIITLIDEFISKSSKRLALYDSTDKFKYEPVIRQVAAELLNSLDNSLPTLKTISRKYALSESTLKRNFKVIYGKNISEFYLEKKMAHAMTLVSECKRTVSEIAYMLGYEKVSNFITLFKKHHGCQPGALQKYLLQQAS
jgi:AraC-like DNA-binding protein